MTASELNPPTPTFDHLGPSRWWRCPHCCLHVLLFPALGNNHVCANQNPNVSVKTFFYYYELSEDHRVRSLNLVGVIEDDPLLRVTSFTDGVLVEWSRKSVAGELRFYPPDPEQAASMHMWFDDRIQRHELVPREELEYRAMRGRHSA
jgi:hypothetical protein